MINSPLKPLQIVNSNPVKFHTFSSIPFDAVKIISLINLYTDNFCNKRISHEPITSCVMEAMCSFITQMHAQVLPNFR